MKESVIAKAIFITLASVMIVYFLTEAVAWIGDTQDTVNEERRNIQNY